jgi:exodeoxyribonuclease VII small subunit
VKDPAGGVNKRSGMGGAPAPAGEPGGPEALQFEEALARLEQIVSALEAGKLSLEQSLKAFEEGTGLLRLCNRRLQETERRIEILLQGEGELKTEPFRWEEDPA